MSFEEKIKNIDSLIIKIQEDNSLSPEQKVELIERTKDTLRIIGNQHMAEMVGGMYFESSTGFTEEGLYAIAGKKDSVFTMTFLPGTESYERFGESVTGVIKYTQSKRKELDDFLNGQLAGDDVGKEHYGIVCIEVLELSVSEDRKEKLLKGIPTAEVFSVIVIPNRETNNQFGSTEDRTPHILPIEIDSIDPKNEQRICYGFLSRLVQEGVGLCPREVNEYLALKCLLEPHSLTVAEREKVYGVDGEMVDEVTEPYLGYKMIHVNLNEDEKNRQSRIRRERLIERIKIIRKEIEKSGVKIEEQVAEVLSKKCVDFRERRYSITEKNPVYLDFKGYVHILMRHAREFKMNNGFEIKDKFQMEWENVHYVLGRVVKEVMAEYQKKRESGKTTDYIKNGDQAIYVLGDYYAIRIGGAGNIISFYKESP